MSTDDGTIAHYQTSVPFYTLAFDRSHSRHLDAFLELQEPGARILELGCGTGRDAARMVECGFAIDPTDGTPAMVAKANERHAVKARLMRFEDLDAEAKYDAVWAHACLMHVPIHDLPTVLDSIYKALRFGGMHYGSFKLGTDQFRDDRGRLNSTVSQEFIESLYIKCCFELLESKPWQGKGADGVMRDWIAVTVRKS